MSTPTANWYADGDDRDAPRSGFPWQPVLVEAASAVVLTSCETYFRTERECLDFIETYLVGAGLDP